MKDGWCNIKQKSIATVELNEARSISFLCYTTYACQKAKSISLYIFDRANEPSEHFQSILPKTGMTDTDVILHFLILTL